MCYHEHSATHSAALRGSVAFGMITPGSATSWLHPGLRSAAPQSGAQDSLAAAPQCSRVRRTPFPQREVPVIAQNESILSYAACLGAGLPETEGDCPPKLRAIGNLPLTGQGISACGRGNVAAAPQGGGGSPWAEVYSKEMGKAAAPEARE